MVKPRLWRRHFALVSIDIVLQSRARIADREIRDFESVTSKCSFGMRRSPTAFEDEERMLQIALDASSAFKGQKGFALNHVAFEIGEATLPQAEFRFRFRLYKIDCFELFDSFYRSVGESNKRSEPKRIFALGTVKMVLNSIVSNEVLLPLSIFMKDAFLVYH